METETNQEWMNVVKKDIEEIDAKYKLSKLNARFNNKKYRIILALFMILVFGLFICSFIFRHKLKSTHFGIAGMILLLISLFVWDFIYQKFFSTRKKFLNELNLKKYYASALNEMSNKTYNLSSLKKQFDLAPRNFLPNVGENRTDNVLNIIGKGTKFSFGTITNEVITHSGSGKNRTVKYTYTRYRYLTINLLKETELVAIIKKSVPSLKIFKLKNSVDSKSTEFNKIFAVVANNQILIRKLLSPKVLANLVDKANNESQIPAFEFKNQSVTISWPCFSVNSWTSTKGAIAEPKFFGNNKNLADVLCQKIVDDINLFLNCLTWFDTYEAL